MAYLFNWIVLGFKNCIPTPNDQAILFSVSKTLRKTMVNFQTLKFVDLRYHFGDPSKRNLLAPFYVMNDFIKSLS